MEKVELEQLLTSLGFAVQDNATMISALVKLLIDKQVISFAEFQKAKLDEDTELESMIQEHLEELDKSKLTNKNERSGFMGKGGDA